jgi:hypothetical protein
VDWYDLTICAEPPGQLRLLGRATLTTRYGLAAFAGADTVIVPGVADVHAEPSPAVVTALRKAHRRGARVVSICSGAFAWPRPACWTGAGRPPTGATPICWPSVTRGCWSTPMCSMWTMATCSPAPAARPASICVSTLYGRTSAPASPTRSPAAW